MTWPTVLVEIAFATDPADAPTWTDVTSYCRGISIRRGRESELDRFNPGSCTLTMDNLDRRFDPTYAAGPYYPNVLPMRRVRISTQYAADDYATEVLADSPVGYWRLGEPSGTTAEDSSGNNRDGTYSGGFTLGVTGAVSGDTAADFNGSTGVVTIANNAAFQFTTDCTVEAWVKPDAVSADAVITKGDNFSDPDYMLFLTLSGTGIGDLSFWNGTAWTTSAALPIVAGQWQHVAATFDGVTVRLFYNGQLIHSNATATTIQTSTGSLRIAQQGSTAGSNNFDGSIDEVALYETALSPTRIAAHYHAAAPYRLFSGYVQRWPQQYRADGKDALVTIEGIDGFMVLALAQVNASYGSQLSGARIHAVLDTVGWPSSDRAIDVGQTTLQASTLVNVPGLEHLQTVTLTENGRLFMDGRGNIVFLDRTSVMRDPYVAPITTFGDAAGEQPYSDVEIAYDDTFIWNDVRVTRTGGTEQTASDATSQSKYYTRTLQRTGLLYTSDPEASDAATFLRDLYKEPAVRATALRISPQRTDTLWPLVLGTEFGHNITINRRPPGGGAITFTSTVEAITHDVTPTKIWHVGWKLGWGHATANAFVLDVSELDDGVLGF